MPRRVPRRQFNPYFLRAIRLSAIPHWRLSLDAGFRHTSHFSKQLTDGQVPFTPKTTALYETVARLVGFPQEQIFLLNEHDETAPAANEAVAP